MCSLVALAVITSLGVYIDKLTQRQQVETDNAIKCLRWYLSLGSLGRQ